MRLACLCIATTCAISVALFGGDSRVQPPRQFCQATAGYRFSFPRDHFSHPCFRTEWWYVTGNLATNNGHRFGFELTFFREAVDNPYQNSSRWRIDDLYLAHFAVSDLQAGKFYYTERLNRAGIELAGVDQSRGRIWNGDWSVEIRGSGLNESWSVDASDGGYKIHLVMRTKKAPVLEGEQGLSQKAPGVGNASYYYSLTRLETSGSLVVNGAAYEVAGLSWMDHEFFTHSLAPNQTGWDWISLQMDDGTEWMLYQFRRVDGSRDPFSSGTFVDRDGKATHLNAVDFEMRPLETWHSPHSAANYPVAWRVVVPKLGFEAEMRASLADQELVSAASPGLTYWEGSIAAKGDRRNRGVTGRGYLEMTGYAGPISPTLSPK